MSLAVENRLLLCGRADGADNANPEMPPGAGHDTSSEMAATHPRTVDKRCAAAMFHI
jgi:hypothetical protein